MKLTADLQKRLRRALIAAFPLRGQLDIVVGDADMDDGAGGRMTYARFLAMGMMQDAVIDALLLWVDANNYVVQFATAAHKANDRNSDLNAVYAAIAGLEAKFQAQSPDKPLGHAERVFFKELGFELAGEWLDRMARNRRAVCRIEPQPQTAGIGGYGTGFLIAPDVVMTNDHVAASS